MYNNEKWISNEMYERQIQTIARRIMRRRHYSPDVDYIRHILEQSITDKLPNMRQLKQDLDTYAKAIEYLLSDYCKCHHGIVNIEIEKEKRVKT